MQHTHIFLKVEAATLDLTEFQMNTLRTLSPAESSQLGLTTNPNSNSIHCTFKKRKGEVDHRAIPLPKVSVTQPKSRSLAIIIGDPGVVRVTDPLKKSWYMELDGASIIGKCFEFMRRDTVKRGDPSAGYVAALRLKEGLNDAPPGTFIRIPIELVCAAERISEY